MDNIVLNSFKEGWKPSFKGNIIDWIENFCSLSHNFAIPGKVNLHRSKYLIQPLLSLSNHSVRQVNCMAGVQSGKSLLADLYKLYLVGNDSGTMLCLSQNDQMSDRLVETRLIPLLYKCPPIKALLPKDRFAISKTDIYFPHFNIHNSAAKESVLQSITAKILTGDEVYLWKDGFIDQAKKRTAAFPHTKKILFTSTAGSEDGEWSTEFNRGIIHQYGWVCPSCQHNQIYQWSKKCDGDKWAGIVWDRNDVTKPDGLWNYREAGKTARLVCEKCFNSVYDNPQSRKYLNDSGVYIVTNSNGDPTIHSYRWNSLANMDISFSSLVIQYLQAKDLIKTIGLNTAYQEFEQKLMARPWADKMQSRIADILTESYSVSEEWGDYKVMTIDVQGTEFWFVIRNWSKSGESRLVKWGHCATWSELRQVQLDNQVKDQNCLIDTGHRTTEIYAKCIEYGHEGIVNGRKTWLSWCGLKGWDADDFAHSGGVKKLYSELSWGDPSLGKEESKGRKCPLYRWSNKSIKNILSHLRDGKGAKWIAAPELVDDYYKQAMNSEVLIKEIDKRTNREKFRWVVKPQSRQDLWDCECEQVVFACMVGILGNTVQ